MDTIKTKIFELNRKEFLQFLLYIHFRKKIAFYIYFIAAQIFIAFEPKHFWEQLNIDVPVRIGLIIGWTAATMLVSANAIRKTVRNPMNSSFFKPRHMEFTDTQIQEFTFDNELSFTNYTSIIKLTRYKNNSVVYVSAAHAFMIPDHVFASPEDLKVAIERMQGGLKKI
jgi:hypothetical protein